MFERAVPQPEPVAEVAPEPEPEAMDAADSSNDDNWVALPSATEPEAETAGQPFELELEAKDEAPAPAAEAERVVVCTDECAAADPSTHSSCSCPRSTAGRSRRSRRRR